LPFHALDPESVQKEIVYQFDLSTFSTQSDSFNRKSEVDLAPLKAKPIGKSIRHVHACEE
jgi:hypothetical protein